MISDTSRAAYNRAKKTINRSQDAVLQVIRAHPEGLTNAEIAHYMQIPVNRVTPRTGELRDEKELIYDVGVRLCRVTKSPAHAYKAKSPVLPPAFPEVKVEQTKQTLF